jgi:hypothetical protein
MEFFHADRRNGKQMLAAAENKPNLPQRGIWVIFPEPHDTDKKHPARKRTFMRQNK